MGVSAALDHRIEGGQPPIPGEIPGAAIGSFPVQTKGEQRAAEAL